MIGVSVSGCIADICRGEKGINDFEKIVGGTCCANEKDWEIVIETYSKTFWQDFPQEAERVLRKLLAEGRIVQPRLTNNSRFPWVSVNWLNSEEEIQWSIP